MDNIKQMITSIDLDNLLKIFDIQISIAILVFFILFRGIFSRVLIKLYYMLTRSKKNPKDSSMYKPLNIFFVCLGIFLTINILPISKQVLYILNKIFKIIIIYYITKAVSTLITPESAWFKKVFKKSDNKAVDRFICKIIRAILWVIFVFLVLNELGYTNVSSALGGIITGLGIGSAALVLAAQDLVKSLLSGVAILTDKPFIIGDWIEVGKYQGTVVDITFRSTRIKSYNNAVITIPNSTITSDYVINWNRLTSRRFDCTLGVSLDTPPDKLKKVVKEIKLVLENNPKVIKGTTQVAVDAISASSTDIKIYLYVNESEYVKFIRAKEDILCSLLFVCAKENIELAYPTQTLYVRKDDIKD